MSTASRVIPLDARELSDFNAYHQQLGLPVQPSLAIYHCPDKTPAATLHDLATATATTSSFRLLAAQVQQTGSGPTFHYTLGRDGSRPGNLNNVLARAGIRHPSGVPYDIYEHGIDTYGSDRVLTRGTQNATALDQRDQGAACAQLVLFAGETTLPPVEPIRLDDNDVDTSVDLTGFMRQMAEFEVDTTTEEVLATLEREYEEEVVLQDQLKDAGVVREKVEAYLASADRVVAKRDRTVELCTRLQGIVSENEASALRNKALGADELEQVSRTSECVDQIHTTLATTLQFMRTKKRIGNTITRFSNLSGKSG
jgi:hypothetical protein